jgi:hypothetical protein
MATLFYIPDGPKNLKSLFPVVVDWDQVTSYVVEAQDYAAHTLATTSINFLDTCCERGARIHFVNASSGMDAINMKIMNDESATKSETYRQPVSYPQDKSEHAISRTNLEGNNTITATTVDYHEEDMQWLDELLNAPAAWLEWYGTQGQPDSYLPIVIADGKKTNRKYEDRYEYEFSIEFIMSHDKTMLRN